MAVCIILAGIISLLSIFAFFGDAFSNTGGTIIPNMFHLMFGSTVRYGDYYVTWKQYGGLTFLFGLQIAIMVAAVVGFIVSYKIKTDYVTKGFSVAFALIVGTMSLAASIVSFCTLAITDINYGGYTVRLGFGPVFYSILHLACVLLWVGGIWHELSQPKYNPTRYSSVRSSSSPNQPIKPTPSVYVAPSRPVNTVLSQNEKDEKKRELEWDLRAGNISQEEFNQKLAALGETAPQALSTDSQKMTSEESPKETLPVEAPKKEAVPPMTEEKRIQAIREYKKLLDEGILTQEEFDQKKKDLLSQ